MNGSDEEEISSFNSELVDPGLDIDEKIESTENNFESNYERDQDLIHTTPPIYNDYGKYSTRTLFNDENTETLDDFIDREYDEDTYKYTGYQGKAENRSI